MYGILLLNVWNGCKIVKNEPTWRRPSLMHPLMMIWMCWISHCLHHWIWVLCNVIHVKNMFISIIRKFFSHYKGVWHLIAKSLEWPQNRQEWAYHMAFVNAFSNDDMDVVTSYALDSVLIQHSSCIICTYSWSCSTDDASCFCCLWEVGILM